MASKDLVVARLATVLDRFDEAAPAFDRARRRTEASGCRPLRAIVDHDEAVARSWRGQPGAPALRDAAAAAFDALGMAAWSRRVGEPVLSAPQPAASLTRREVEVLRLLAGGRSNKQIAAELVVSVHTVERHVQNAYRKIGARNRAEATAFAVREGV
jgi:DNA-binding NarL/FixJ family response regulator